MFCRKCGQMVKNGERFCHLCGTPVETVSKKAFDPTSAFKPASFFEAAGTRLQQIRHFCSEEHV